MLGRDATELLEQWRVAHVGTDSEVDITDPDAVAAAIRAHRPTHILNCAAYTRTDDAESEEETARRVNGIGPEILGRAATRTGTGLVHISTDYVFAGAGERPYREDDPTGPINAYGRSKLEGETRLQAACPRSFIVRTSWLFGLHGPNFVATMLRLMADREEIRVVDDQRGRPTHSLDLARACLALIGIGPDAVTHADFGCYHFANTGAVTWHGFACGIRHLALERGRPLATTRIIPVTSDAFPRPARRPSWSVLDTTRIEQTLGYTPRPWDAALREYLDRMDVNGDGNDN